MNYATYQYKYDEIMRTYEKRQLDRQQLIIDERKRNLPGLIRNSQRSTADCQIQRCDCKQLERRYFRAGTSAQKDPASLSAATDLLKEYGYPENYLQPVYTARIVRMLLYQQSACHCSKQASIDLVYTQSTLP